MAIPLFFHSFKDLLDAPTAMFWETADAVGFLSARLDFNGIPEPAGVVMIPGDLLPRYVLVRVTEPEESPGLDDNLLGREMNLLGNQSSSEQDCGQEGCLGAVGFDHGNLLLAHKIVTTILAFPGGSLGELRTLWTLLADDSAPARMTHLRLIGYVTATFWTGFHKARGMRLATGSVAPCPVDLLARKFPGGSISSQ